MLFAVLRTNVAEDISIKIMDTFVLMKNYIYENLIEQKFINKLEDRVVIQSLLNKVNNILK